MGFLGEIMANLKPFNRANLPIHTMLNESFFRILSNLRMGIV